MKLEFRFFYSLQKLALPLEIIFDFHKKIGTVTVHILPFYVQVMYVDKRIFT